MNLVHLMLGSLSRPVSFIEETKCNPLTNSLALVGFEVILGAETVRKKRGQISLCITSARHLIGS